MLLLAMIGLYTLVQGMLRMGATQVKTRSNKGEQIGQRIARQRKARRLTIITARDESSTIMHEISPISSLVRQTCSTGCTARG